MADFFGQKTDRRELLKRVGDMAQLAYIKSIEYTAGKARGVKAFEISNGTGLELTVLESKCMDIISMRYKGVNLSYLPKSGIVAPALADMNGTEFMRSISGGMLYTCGLLNVGTACVDDGVTNFFHGRMKNTPAENVNLYQDWKGDDYYLTLSGEMKEAGIFSDNLRLSRTLSLRCGDRSVSLEDEIENLGFQEQGLMLMYHINIGYPLLDEGSRLLIPSVSVRARDDHSQTGAREYAAVTAPVDEFTEHVFYHQAACLPGGETFSALINDRLGLGVYIRYNTRDLPNLVQWKSMRSGDYAMGIMPATCFVTGRVNEKEHGSLRMIQSLEKIRINIELGVLEGKVQIASFEESMKALK